MAYLWFDSKVVLSRLASSFPLTPLHGLLVAVGMAGVATYWGGGGRGGGREEEGISLLHMMSHMMSQVDTFTPTTVHVTSI